MYYAHTSPEGGGDWQELKDHLEGTAELAKEFASTFEAGDWGYLAGLWHDSGKYSQEFQKMLRASADAHIEQKSRVDHSTYGAQKAVEKWIAEGKLLAYAIAGHHGGLPEGISTADSCLAQRLQKPLAYKFDCPAILFEQSKPSLPFAPEQTRFYFELSFFIRMLYSCLVDADFLNTEKHMNPTQSQMRTSVPSLGNLNNKLKDHLIALQSAAKQTKVNTIRAEILSDCLNASGQEPGLFSLTVPTGGGKTLSSLAFGLNHALRWGHERIIYVIPSVLSR
jgi:CRISPR-associated endonuclease/helicase Cas3